MKEACSYNFADLTTFFYGKRTCLRDESCVRRITKESNS